VFYCSHFCFFAFFSLSFFSASNLASTGDRYRPFNLGKVIHGFFPLPIMKMLPILVAKPCPLSSVTWTISNPPKCLYLEEMIPTLPTLFPAVIKHVLPASNLTKSTILPVAISTLTVSPTWTSGWGNLIVLASWVTMYGILFGPTPLLVTLQILNLASSLDKFLRTNLPFTS